MEHKHCPSITDTYHVVIMAVITCFFMDYFPKEMRLLQCFVLLVISREVGYPDELLKEANAKPLPLAGRKGSIHLGPPTLSILCFIPFIKCLCHSFQQQKAGVVQPDGMVLKSLPIKACLQCYNSFDAVVMHP